MNKVQLLVDGNQQIVNFHLSTKAQLIMSAHTETRRQEHGAKQLMETTGIVIEIAQEFKIQFL